MRPAKLADVTAALDHVSPRRLSAVSDHAPIAQFDPVSRLTGVLLTVILMGSFLSAVLGGHV
jgi:hypothetical protein